MVEESDIELIEKKPAVKEGDFSPYCSNWEYRLASQLPEKPLQRMIRRGNLSEVCGLYILKERKEHNAKWEPVEK